MPCYGEANAQTMEISETKRQRLAALERLLGKGTASVKLNARGVAEISGWEERGDWCDTCAYRVLLAEGSSELRMALARSQTQATGRAQAR